jgi:hypothetical protein
MCNSATRGIRWAVLDKASAMSPDQRIDRRDDRLSLAALAGRR